MTQTLNNKKFLQFLSMRQDKILLVNGTIDLTNKTFEGGAGRMKYELKQCIKTIYTAIHLLETQQQIKSVKKPLKNNGVQFVPSSIVPAVEPVVTGSTTIPALTIEDQLILYNQKLPMSFLTMPIPKLNQSLENIVCRAVSQTSVASIPSQSSQQYTPISHLSKNSILNTTSNLESVVECENIEETNSVGIDDDNKSLYPYEEVNESDYEPMEFNEEETEAIQQIETEQIQQQQGLTDSQLENGGTVKIDTEEEQEMRSKLYSLYTSDRISYEKYQQMTSLTLEEQTQFYSSYTIIPHSLEESFNLEQQQEEKTETKTVEISSDNRERLRKSLKQLHSAKITNIQQWTRTISTYTAIKRDTTTTQKTISLFLIILLGYLNIWMGLLGSIFIIGSQAHFKTQQILGHPYKSTLEEHLFTLASTTTQKQLDKKIDKIVNETFADSDITLLKSLSELINLIKSSL